MLCNLVLDELDPDVDVVRGLPRGGPTTAAALDDSFDAMFLVAHHAKVRDYPGYCAHTISYGEYDDVRLDGRTISEGEIFATIAAQNGVPTALITGDDVVAAEMAKVTPGIEPAIVKRAMSRTGGWIVPPKRAATIITDAAARAVEKVRAGADRRDRRLAPVPDGDRPAQAVHGRGSGGVRPVPGLRARRRHGRSGSSRTRWRWPTAWPPSPARSRTASTSGRTRSAALTSTHACRRRAVRRARRHGPRVGAQGRHPRTPPSTSTPTGIPSRWSSR